MCCLLLVTSECTACAYIAWFVLLTIKCHWNPTLTLETCACIAQAVHQTCKLSLRSTTNQRPSSSSDPIFLWVSPTMPCYAHPVCANTHPSDFHTLTATLAELYQACKCMIDCLFHKLSVGSKGFSCIAGQLKTWSRLHWLAQPAQTSQS